MTQRPPKKSESLEIRLSHADKAAFMRACRAEGRTASEVLRAAVDRRLTSSRKTFRLGHFALGAAAATALAAAAAPSLARPFADAQFQAIDRDRDRAINSAEFLRLDGDGDGAVSAGEFSSARERTAPHAS